MSADRPTGWEEADRWFARGAPPGGPPPGGGEPPPPGGGEPPPGGGEPPPEPRCAVCGAALEPDQTYCLECGSPTPLAPRLSRPRAGLALAAAITVLGLGAGALAIAIAAGDDDAAAAPTTVATATVPTVPPPATGTLPPDTGPLPPDTSFTDPFEPPPPGTGPDDPAEPPPADTGFPTVTVPPAPPAPGPQPDPDRAPPDPGPADASDWPAGRTAWTAVLSSVRSREDAVAARGRVRASGEPAGVLVSSDHPNLRPGYYVVFSGVFASRQRAAAQAAALRGRFPSAYARRISG